jgi:transcription elongation factor GreA
MARTRKAKQTQDENKLLVTQERLDDMQQELNHRLNTLRPQIAEEISVARDFGDLSENQPYTDAMNRKDLNEARIEELEYLVSIAQVIQKDDSHHVSIGDTIRVKKILDGKVRTITLVGREETQEADPTIGKVSVDSPLGSAIAGKLPGDKIVVKLAGGAVEYEIMKAA